MMNAQVIFCLTLALLVSGGHMVTVTITNKCPYTIWPGTLANPDFPQLSETGFELPSGGTKPLNVPAGWAGRFWGRTQCSNHGGSFRCATADCATGQVGCNGKSPIQPVTLVEIALASDNGQDFYNVSVVDGYNLDLAVAPQGGTGTGCVRAGCSGINEICPAELRSAGSDGSVIACKSACLAFGTPQYCCTGAFEQNCPPTNYSQIFKNQCPDAYSRIVMPRMIPACFHAQVSLTTI